MSNLGGHDLSVLLDAFDAAAQHDRPVCFIAYTIKGFGLPFQGHKDNHSGLMTPAQMDAWRVEMGIRPGFEWEPLERLNVDPQAYAAALEEVPFVQEDQRRRSALTIAVPEELPWRAASNLSTQAGFGLILGELAAGNHELAERVVTTAPDVTVSTNLGGWVNRRRLFSREAKPDTFKREQSRRPIVGNIRRRASTLSSASLR